MKKIRPARYVRLQAQLIPEKFVFTQGFINITLSNAPLIKYAPYSGGSRPGVWGAVKWGETKCLHLLNTKSCLRQSSCFAKSVKKSVSNAFPTWLETERFFLDLEVTTHIPR